MDVFEHGACELAIALSLSLEEARYREYMPVIAVDDSDEEEDVNSASGSSSSAVVVQANERFSGDVVSDGMMDDQHHEHEQFKSRPLQASADDACEREAKICELKGNLFALDLGVSTIATETLRRDLAGLAEMGNLDPVELVSLSEHIERIDDSSRRSCQIEEQRSQTEGMSSIVVENQNASVESVTPVDETEVVELKRSEDFSMIENAFPTPMEISEPMVSVNHLTSASSTDKPTSVEVKQPDTRDTVDTAFKSPVETLGLQVGSAASAAGSSSVDEIELHTCHIVDTDYGTPVKQRKPPAGDAPSDALIGKFTSVVVKQPDIVDDACETPARASKLLGGSMLTTLVPDEANPSRVRAAPTASSPTPAAGTKRKSWSFCCRRSRSHVEGQPERSSKENIEPPSKRPRV